MFYSQYTLHLTALENICFFMVDHNLDHKDSVLTLHLTLYYTTQQTKILNY
jgi:hypothetical protein